MHRTTFILAMLATFSANAGAALLGSYTRSPVGIAQPNPVPDGLSFHLAIGSLTANCFNLNECSEMFLIENFDSSIVGTVFSIDSNYAGFPAVVNALTNGIDDHLTGSMVFASTFPQYPAGGFGHDETLFGKVPGPDFAGDTIDLITFRFDSIALYQTFILDFFTFQLRPATQALVGYTVGVYGTAGVNEIPEPGSLSLAGAGIAAIVLGRALQRRSGL